MFASAQAAENAFYEAFSSGDVDAMMRVWADTHASACIHPGGPRLEGYAAIRDSWSLIFTDSMPRSFALRGLQISATDRLCVHTLEEHISVPGTAFVAPPVIATNVYQRFDAGWLMILHHASVAPTARPRRRAGAVAGDGPPRVH